MMRHPPQAVPWCAGALAKIGLAALALLAGGACGPSDGAEPAVRGGNVGPSAAALQGSSGGGATACSFPPAPDLASRTSQLEAALQSAYSGTSTWSTYTCTTTSGGPTVRDMLWKAIAELNLPSGAGGDVADADRLVRLALRSLQPSGFFPWQLCNTSLGSDDANSLEFSSLALGIILRGHASQLQPATISSATASLPRILAALACDVSASCASSPRGSVLNSHYTNIWLTNAAAQMVLAGVAGLDSAVSAAALSQGLAELTSWNGLTQTNGIIEFDSPTYYEVDVESLEVAYAFAGAAQRGVIQQALDWLWGDIADNFFPARGTLSGAHSRNYDFITDHGSIDWHTYMLGWRASVPQPSTNPVLERALLLEIQQHADAYAPSAAIAGAGCASKVVTSLWGNAANGATRYNVVAAPYELSSVSAGFGPQDQEFVAEIGNDNLPVIDVVVDDTNDPYGDTKVTSGLFAKPVHLVPRPLGVQAQGDLFGLLEITPSLTSTSLATNIIFPLHAATVLLNQTPVPASTIRMAASTKSVLGVMDSNGCVAVRILMADSYGSTRPAPVEVVVDAAGLALGVGRLVAYHAQPHTDGSPIACTAATWTAGDAPIECQPRAAVVMKAGACSTNADLLQLMTSVADATLTTTDASAQTWTAALSFDRSTFNASRNRATGQILSQSLNGTPITFSGALSISHEAEITALPTPALPAFWGRALLGSALAFSGLWGLRRAPSRARRSPDRR